ncbi:MAG: pyridoxamine 5'-phosphate oxidase [Myxococcales bacterium]|jgi:pyridoxamine 5'-phosphate oxidase|nr:MAG: pyridoxamine 5'-phosphate oxidase [Myxococcales bacterium]
MAVDPIRRFKSWYAEARRAEAPLPEAVALATADARGRPSVRWVLLKDVDERGFVFYTNSGSRKGRELEVNPHAALAFYWDVTGKQVRVEGHVTRVSGDEADAYWSGRPQGSQVAAAASKQSAPVESRAELMSEYRKLSRLHVGSPVPRPPQWTGFRIVPERIEFWTRREPRLHQRELFVRRRDDWKRTILQP